MQPNLFVNIQISLSLPFLPTILRLYYHQHLSYFQKTSRSATMNFNCSATYSYGFYDFCQSSSIGPLFRMINYILLIFCLRSFFPSCNETAPTADSELGEKEKEETDNEVPIPALRAMKTSLGSRDQQEAYLSDLSTTLIDDELEDVNSITDDEWGGFTTTTDDDDDDDD